MLLIPTCLHQYRVKVNLSYSVLGVLLSIERLSNIKYSLHMSLFISKLYLFAFIYANILRIMDHYAAVLNQAPSDSLVKVFSDSSPLTNKYDYSFTIPEICIVFKTSRSNTAPGSDGIPT